MLRRSLEKFLYRSGLHEYYPESDELLIQCGEEELAATDSQPKPPGWSEMSDCDQRMWILVRKLHICSQIMEAGNLKGMKRVISFGLRQYTKYQQELEGLIVQQQNGESL